MSRSRRPSRTLLTAFLVATALIITIVYFGLNPDPNAALVATAIFVIVIAYLYVFGPVHDLLMMADVVAWLSARRRGDDDRDSGSHD